MILQLSPPVPLDTPKGRGDAHLVIDYGPEHSLVWVVFVDATGECWAVPNREVRLRPNWTAGRRPASTIQACTPPSADCSTPSSPTPPTTPCG